MAAPDQRDIEDVAYPAPLLLLLGLFMMLEPSRDAFDACCERSGGRTLLDNCLRFLGYPPDKVKELPHSVTIDRYLRDLDPTFLRDLIIDLFRHLIRSKALHAAKLFKTFRFTIDATHTVRRHQRHCPTCLTCTHKNGTTDYFHVVVSVLLVTPSGLCIPVLSKAADNPADGNYDKQNCEINTAKLIIPELKKLFPQLDVTLIGDALYACEPIIDLCEKNRWSYILSFKDGSLPTLWKAAEKQRQETPASRTRSSPPKETAMSTPGPATSSTRTKTSTPSGLSAPSSTKTENPRPPSSPTSPTGVPTLATSVKSSTPEADCANTTRIATTT
jgi:hypothetical protein